MVNKNGGEDKYASGLCLNCNKDICEDCEIRILHEGVLDVVLTVIIHWVRV
jgi:hypothetical protein